MDGEGGAVGPPGSQLARHSGAVPAARRRTVGHRGLSVPVERLIRGELAAQVQQYDAADLAGVSCIAGGPDAWFAEAVLEHGGRIEAVVPAEQYRDELPEPHHAIYDKLITQAAEVRSTGMRESTEQAHMAGSEILVGLVDRLVGVWDGKPARG